MQLILRLMIFGFVWPSDDRRHPTTCATFY